MLLVVPGGTRAAGSVLAGAEGRVERRLRLVEVEGTDELERTRSAEEAVHAGVLPLDGDRPVVADGVEGAEAVLPRYVAVAGRDEVPPAPRVAPRQVRRQTAVAAVADPLAGVLAVDVVDPVLEVPDEAGRVEVLPHHVAGVPVEAERLPVADRVERRDGAPVVVRDLARVHLVGEPDPHLVEDVED